MGMFTPFYEILSLNMWNFIKIIYTFRIRLNELISAIFVIVFLANNSIALAESQDTREYALKAGYIYNLTTFIHWPKEVNRQINDSGLTFCVAGENPFGTILGLLKEKLQAKGKKILIKYRVSSKEMPECHVLFINRSENKYLEQILTQVEGYPVLVVSDTPRFAERGVGINLYIQGNRVRFEINVEAIDRSGLRVSSGLLNLAKIVSGRG